MRVLGESPNEAAAFPIDFLDHQRQIEQAEDGVVAHEQYGTVDGNVFETIEPRRGQRSPRSKCGT